MTDPQDPFTAPAPDIPVYGPPPVYGAPVAPPPPYGAPVGYQPGAPGSPGLAKNGLGTAALVLGIVGAIPFLSWTFIGSILAIVFGAIGRNRAQRHEATNRAAASWGLGLGIVGVVFGATLWGLVVHEVSSPGGQRWRDCVDRATAHNDTAAENRCNEDFVDYIFGRPPTSG
jgi:hypothetical protein